MTYEQEKALRRRYGLSLNDGGAIWRMNRQMSGGRMANADTQDLIDRGAFMRLSKPATQKHAYRMAYSRRAGQGVLPRSSLSRQTVSGVYDTPEEAWLAYMQAQHDERARQVRSNPDALPDGTDPSVMQHHRGTRQDYGGGTYGFVFNGDKRKQRPAQTMKWSDTASGKQQWAEIQKMKKGDERDAAVAAYRSRNGSKSGYFSNGAPANATLVFGGGNWTNYGSDGKPVAVTAEHWKKACNVQWAFDRLNDAVFNNQYDRDTVFNELFEDHGRDAARGSSDSSPDQVVRDLRRVVKAPQALAEAIGEARTAYKDSRGGGAAQALANEAWEKTKNLYEGTVLGKGPSGYSASTQKEMLNQADKMLAEAKVGVDKALTDAINDYANGFMANVQVNEADKAAIKPMDVDKEMQDLNKQMQTWKQEADNRSPRPSYGQQVQQSREQQGTATTTDQRPVADPGQTVTTRGNNIDDILKLVSGMKAGRTRRADDGGGMTARQRRFMENRRRAADELLTRFRAQTAASAGVAEPDPEKFREAQRRAAGVAAYQSMAARDYQGGRGFEPAGAPARDPDSFQSETTNLNAALHSFDPKVRAAAQRDVDRAMQERYMSRGNYAPGGTMIAPSASRPLTGHGVDREINFPRGRPEKSADYQRRQALLRMAATGGAASAAKGGRTRKSANKALPGRREAGQHGGRKE